MKSCPSRGRGAPLGQSWPGRQTGRWAWGLRPTQPAQRGVPQQGRRSLDGKHVGGPEGATKKPKKTESKETSQTSWAAAWGEYCPPSGRQTSQKQALSAHVQAWGTGGRWGGVRMSLCVHTFAGVCVCAQCTGGHTPSLSRGMGSRTCGCSSPCLRQPSVYTEPVRADKQQQGMPAHGFILMDSVWGVGCVGHDKFKFCFSELSRVFFPEHFQCAVGGIHRMKPTETEGPSYMHVCVSVHACV